TGEVTRGSFVITPMMTIAALKEIIAAHSDVQIVPTPAQFTNLTSDEFPVRSYPPEKQAKINADWRSYRRRLGTLAEFELPELEVETLPVNYKIQGLLSFQHDLARQVRLWMRLPTDMLSWEDVTRQQEFKHHQLCASLLEARLGVPHHVRS